MKLLIAIFLMVLIAGCEKVNTSESESVRTESPHGVGYHFTTNKGLECFYVNGSYDGGLSCNWEAYNQRIAKCKSKSLKDRTFYDANGKKVIFPAVEGDC